MILVQEAKKCLEMCWLDYFDHFLGSRRVELHTHAGKMLNLLNLYEEEKIVFVKWRQSCVSFPRLEIYTLY
jgi:hypothetical protein